MPLAFHDDADFDAIHEKLAISEVIHEAYMKVDEQGTESAAATAVAMRATSMPPEPTEFTVDRPFLFVARVVDPTTD